MEGFGLLSRPSSPPGGLRLRKRPSKEMKENSIPTKRFSNPTLITLLPALPSPFANNKLREKNNTRLHLLAKDLPKKPYTIPQFLPSVISAKPQDRLPKVIPTASLTSWPTTTNWTMGNSQQQQQQQLPGEIRMMPQQQHPFTSNMPRSNFPDKLLQSNQQQQQFQLQQPLQDSTRITNNNYIPWDQRNSDDQDLNKLLDQLFEKAPDAISEEISDPNLLGMIELIEHIEVFNNTDNSIVVNNVTLNSMVDGSATKEMAINAIKKSFMSYEQTIISSTMQQQINQNIALRQRQQHQQQNQQAAQQQKAYQMMNQPGQQFLPPPMYQQGPNRMQPHHNSPQLSNRMITQQQYAVATSTGQYSAAQLPNHSRSSLHTQQKRLLFSQQQECCRQ